MPGADQDDVAGPQPSVRGQALAVEAAAQIVRRDLDPAREGRALETFDVEEDATRDEDRRLLDPEPRQPGRRPDFVERLPL